MPSQGRHLTLIGGLLEYPRADYAVRLERSADAVRAGDVEAYGLLRKFSSRIESLSLERLQELYTRTFDLNPVCSLEVGWQLYGEDYARGDFLLSMRAQLRRHGIPESGELPDHLTHLLMLLDQVEPAEAQEFAEGFLAPALRKMLAGFPEQGNPYRHLLTAAEKLLALEVWRGSLEAPYA